MCCVVLMFVDVFVLVKKGQIVRVDKEKYLNSVNVSDIAYFN